jgi:cytochrome c
MKHLTKSGLAITLSFVLSSPLLAADGAALYLSKGCVACHGADAKTPVVPQYPKVAGQNKTYVLQQLQDIKSGKRNNGMSAVMAATMAAVSDEEMDALATYISGL